jgi:hypothetical protein
MTKLFARLGFGRRRRMQALAIALALYRLNRACAALESLGRPMPTQIH